MEQIIARLRQAEIEQAKGATVSEICRKIEVTGQTSYRWRKEYGGLQIDQARRLKDREGNTTILESSIQHGRAIDSKSL